MHIFVTGISRGLGRALFDNLLNLQLKPIGIGRAFTSAQNQAKSRMECVLETCDLSNLDQVAASNFGALVGAEATKIILINNAGVITPIGKFSSIERNDFMQSLSVNMLGPFLVAQSLLKRAQTIGVSLKIINISSGAAKRPIPGWTAYCVGKCAVSMAFRCLDAETEGVEVVDVDPGVMDTDMQAEIRAADVENFPARDDFARLFETGSLQNPIQIADEILRQWVLQ